MTQTDPRLAGWLGAAALVLLVFHLIRKPMRFLMLRAFLHTAFGLVRAGEIALLRDYLDVTRAILQQPPSDGRPTRLHLTATIQDKE
jgi:hypothetical protein